MKVLGFVIVTLGLIIGYIAITGSQHRVMAIIFNKAPAKSGKKINPSGTGTQPPAKGQPLPPGVGGIPV